MCIYIIVLFRCIICVSGVDVKCVWIHFFIFQQVMFSTLHLFIVLKENKLKLILPTTCIGMNNAMNLQIYLFLLLLNVVLYQF